MSTLPEFTGKVYLRDDGDSHEYEIHAYQYATTSEPEGTMSPAAIVYVADDNDIKLAIQYARENNLGVAVRSGGHQYIGASSTSGNNIQIDLSGREAADRTTYPYKQSSIDKEEGSVTLGAALDVDDVCDITSGDNGEDGVFFPHGECCGVHIGGHSQTGGWSVITRAFGVMIDHMIRFEIILADGTKRTVKRDNEDPIDKDLWFAVLGGSPGNLGVLTSITVKYLEDKDYPKSRGFKMAWLYKGETLQQLLKIINKMNDDPNSDPDFGMSVMALGWEHTTEIPSLLPKTFDEHMMKHHSNLVGKDKMHWVVPIITVIGAWTNSKGPDQDDSHVQEVFAKFMAVPGVADKDLLNTLFPAEALMDGTETRPLSKILKALTFENPREFNLSAKKLLWFGKNTQSMSQKNELGITFAEWVVKKVDILEKRGLWDFIKKQRKYRGMQAALQVGVLGGPGLANPLIPGTAKPAIPGPDNPPIETAMGQRDGNYWFAFDIFYDPEIKDSREKATELTNAIANDVRSNKLNLWEDNKERRLILGPMLVNNEKPILDEQWAYYYDNSAVYERLLKIKQKMDPDHIFTANLFCVGATSCSRFTATLASDGS